nr:putative transposase (putative), gypsy type [Tanacetum cinerariifolium]
MVGSSIYIVTTVLTQKELDLHCATHGISTDLRPKLPDRNSIIKDSPPGKIGMYTRFVEFANFCIPLLKFLLCVLEYYQINLSQLSVIGATKISYFELMCHDVGRVPTVGTFHRFYVNSLSNGWFSFSKCSGADDPCCVSKLFHLLPLLLSQEMRHVVLHNQSNAGFLNSFNINTAQHTSMGFELRLRFEYEIMSREKFEKKFTESAAIIHQVDDEIADLKVKLEKAEREAREVTVLRQHVSELEAVATARASKVVALNEQNVKLSAKVSALELVRSELDVKVFELIANCNSLYSEVVGETKMREEFESIQDAATQRLDERVAGLDGRIADVRPIGKVISMAINKGIQEGLKAEIEHGKEGRSLAQIEAYDPETKAKYVVVVFEFENVSFPLLDYDFQPSLDQVSITIYFEFGEVIREMLLSDVISFVRGSAERRGLCPPSSFVPNIILGISNYQISMLAQPHDDFFDFGVLDKPADA